MVMARRLAFSCADLSNHALELHITAVIIRNDTVYHQALKLEYEGRYAEALRLFQRCLDDPAFDEGEILFHCGWCLENELRMQEALQRYARATESTRLPSCKINCFFRSGWIVMHRKDYVQAADAFRRAIDCGDVLEVRDDTYRHAVYWYAVCLETQGRYIEALTWYRYAQETTAQLDPESRLRQIMCLVHIGRYDDALDVCRTFDSPGPVGFNAERYRSLQAEARRERAMLEACLNSSHPHGSVVYADR